MYNIGLAEEILRLVCQKEMETAVPVFCYCEALRRLRFITFKEEKLRATYYAGELLPSSRGTTIYSDSQVALSKGTFFIKN